MRIEKELKVYTSARWWLPLNMLNPSLPCSNFQKILKGKENARKQAYFVKGDLDLEQDETRSLFLQLQKENRQLEEKDKLTIQMRKERIIVNNEPLLSKIEVPSHTDILRLTSEEIEHARAVKLIPAKEHEEKGSEYYTYIHKACTVAEVKKAY